MNQIRSKLQTNVTEVLFRVKTPRKLRCLPSKYPISVKMAEGRHQLIFDVISSPFLSLFNKHIMEKVQLKTLTIKEQLHNQIVRILSHICRKLVASGKVARLNWSLKNKNSFSLKSISSYKLKLEPTYEYLIKCVSNCKDLS